LRNDRHVAVRQHLAVLPLRLQGQQADVLQSTHFPFDEIALRAVAAEGRGMIIYEHQEGRGIGLMNKLRAYQLQDQGADTVEANEQLGFESDLRSYSLPGAILRHLGVPGVRLMSNNPDKVRALEDAGIEVVERVPCIAVEHESRRGYLETKREKMGHLLDI
jgi:GTP cyclohydrolase II